MRLSFISGLVFMAVSVAISMTSSQIVNVDKRDMTTDKPTTEPTSPTTTEPPSSTTESTTTATTSEKTTPITVTTATIPMTTSAPPKPTTPLPPQPKKGHWIVRDEVKNITCILLEAGFRLSFNYLNTSHKVVQKYDIDLPDSANATGICGDIVQTISLHFYHDWELTLSFTMDAGRYNLTSYNLTYNVEDFPAAVPFEPFQEAGPVNMFVTDKNKKYVCVAAQPLYNNKNLTQPGLVSISSYQLQVEAFRTTDTNSFTSNANHCSADEVSQLVPIIVGATLAGLIVVVLIAYLIGRQRSRRGYESV